MDGVNTNKPCQSNKCKTCRRKVGYLGFDCKCGHVYCSEHRYPYAHQCNISTKVEHQTKLQKIMPHVISTTIHNFEKI